MTDQERSARVVSLENLDADRPAERPAVAHLDALGGGNPEPGLPGGARGEADDLEADRPRVATFDELDAPGPARPVALLDDADLAGGRPVVPTARLETRARRADRRSGRVASGDGPGTGADRQGGRGRAGSGQGRESERPEAEADPEAVARSICLRLLTERARTRHELAEALRTRGVPEDAANAVLERFGEVGLIDDAAFAEQWVRSRHTFRGLGRRAIAVELRRKGVDEQAAREALAEVDAEAEERRARELIDRRLRTLRGPPDEAAARRLLGMLARKGYPAGIAYRVVKDALAEHAAELAERLPSGEDD
ncbi:recombination regulator RecX [Pseudonocardia hispaniensis]|uniref:Regulatory protein RecX n=1 Tax=Pseudonocardia hispaniensis TaxID=904933 RepID=A0ABW1IYA4_9PSEU